MSSGSGNSDRCVPAECLGTGMSVKGYRRTREEAIACKNVIPDYEMFDMDTGLVKEKYRRMRSPSPPIGAVVYEINTGRPYEYLGSVGPVRLHPDSVALESARRAAIAAGVWQRPGPTCSERATTGTRDAVPSGAGGLRRVIPLPGDYTARAGPSQAADSHEGDPRVSKRFRRATEKVLGWRTSTPEPLESDGPGSVGERLYMCDCVSLVSSVPVDMDMRAPDLADLDDAQLAENTEMRRIYDASPTLRYLRRGYLNYMKHDLLRDVHRLYAYSCRSAPSKVYNAYKSIVCRSRSPQHASGPSADGTSESVGADERVDRLSRPLYSLHHRAMTIVNQYLNVFSVLTDFTYRLILGDACNALVVDKRYTYNHVRNCHVPYYRLLNGDSYTDLFVNQARKVKNRGINIRHVRFISTSNTLLYTNSLALTRRTERRPVDRGTRAGVAEASWKRRREAPTTSGPRITGETGETTDAEAAHLPLKKRCVYHPSEKTVTEIEETTTSHRWPSPSTSSTDYVLCTKNWPRIEHRPGCSRGDIVHGLQTETSPPPGTSAGETRDETCTARHASDSDETKNPTLVVFKQSLDEKEPDTLICNIVVELHLGDEVKY